MLGACLQRRIVTAARGVHALVVRAGAAQVARRFQLATPPPHFTSLDDENDPERKRFFEYLWGTWMQNDAAEKARRETPFLLRGLTEVLNRVYAAAPGSGQGAAAPVVHVDNVTTLPRNLTLDHMGTISSPLQLTTMVLLHEGRHHRVYKVTALNGRDFVLRIPYGLLPAEGTARMVKSEVATLDWVLQVAGARVPRVYAYALHEHNPLLTPFMLMEHVEGVLLMREWNPAAEGGSGFENAEVLAVVKPIVEFAAQVQGVELPGYGSLYFALEEEGLAVDGGYVVGPSTERVFLKRGGKHGPWGKWEEYAEAVANAAVENVESAAASGEAAGGAALGEAAVGAARRAALVPTHINPDSTAIPTMPSLLAPRLALPDLDPMNVVVTAPGTHAFLDFANVSVAPHALQPNPPFVAYDGPKVFDPEPEPETETHPEAHKLAFFRSRNQFLWELAVAEHAKPLAAAALPAMKLLRGPLVQARAATRSEDLLVVEDAGLRAAQVWPLLEEAGLVQGPHGVETLRAETVRSGLVAYLEQLQQEPFAETQGWCPQDLFEKLVAQGVLVEEAGRWVLKV